MLAERHKPPSRVTNDQNILASCNELFQLGADEPTVGVQVEVRSAVKSRQSGTHNFEVIVLEEGDYSLVIDWTMPSTLDDEDERLDRYFE